MKSIPVDDIFSDPDNLEFEKLDCYEYDKTGFASFLLLS